MSMRFRKTITLAPGLRLNLGARGVSVSAGPRGASVTLGRNGLFGNVGLPGTGLSYRTRLNGRRGSAAESDDPEAPAEVIPITVTIGADGFLILTDPDGSPLPADAKEAALRRNRTTLNDILARRAAELNEWSDRLIRPHLRTPAPGSIADAFVPDPFALPRPEKPDPEDTGLFASWFGGREQIVRAHV